MASIKHHKRRSAASIGLAGTLFAACWLPGDVAAQCPPDVTRVVIISSSRSLDADCAILGPNGALVIAQPAVVTLAGGFHLRNDNLLLNRSEFHNSGELTNRASLINEATGTIRNLAEIMNTATGTIENFGVVRNESGTLLNRGRLNNYNQLVNGLNLFNSGWLENTGSLINDQTFDNNPGAMLAIKPGSTFTNNGTLSNLGSSIGDGAFMEVAGGMLDNTGQLILGSRLAEAGRGSILSVVGGTLRNAGTVTLQNTLGAENFGSHLALAGSELNNLAILTVERDSSLQIGSLFTQDGIRHDSRLQNDGTLTNHGFLYLEGLNQLSNSGLLTNNSAVFNNGHLSNAGTINNDARYEVNVGGAITGTGSYIQSAGTTTVDGNISQGSFTCTAGAIYGDGSYSAASLYIAPSCFVLPGHSPGTLTFDGGAAGVDFAGTLMVEIAGHLDHDVLRVLGGGIHFSAASIHFIFDGYEPAAGERFDFLDGSFDGTYRFSFGGLRPGFSFELALDANGRLGLLTLAVPDGSGNVPLPATLLLTLLALVALQWPRPRLAAVRLSRPS